VYGIPITERERNRLYDGKWYNDTIMEVYITYLQYVYGESVIFFTAYESTWLSGVQHSKIHHCERITKVLTDATASTIVCIRHGGNHWWGEIYDTKTMTVCICNTLGTHSEKAYAHESPFLAISTIFGKTFVEAPRQCIQQDVANTYDCGPLLLWTLSRWNFKNGSSTYVAKQMRSHVADGPYYHFLEGRKRSNGLDGIRRLIFLHPVLGKRTHLTNIHFHIIRMPVCVMYTPK
jgi:hypothetical protein